jgi:hypothetical protein
MLLDDGMIESVRDESRIPQLLIREIGMEEVATQGTKG